MNNGWPEYSKHVIGELERLNKSISILEGDIKWLRGNISDNKAKVDQIKTVLHWKESVDEVISPSQLKELTKDISLIKTQLIQTESIIAWKKAVDEISSPTQLKELIDEVSKLKTFKTQAIMIWVVVQGIFSVLAALSFLYT